MKTSILPSPREGETLSSLIVDAVEERVRNRAIEDEFLARGLASGEKARGSDKHTRAASVLAGLRRKLNRARKAALIKAGGERSRLR